MALELNDGGGMMTTGDVQSSSQIVTINKSTPNFLQAGSCHSCHPTNSVEALKRKGSQQH